MSIQANAVFLTREGRCGLIKSIDHSGDRSVVRTRVSNAEGTEDDIVYPMSLRIPGKPDLDVVKIDGQEWS